MKIGIDIDGVIATNLDINQLHQGNDEEIYRSLTFDENFPPVLEILRQQNYQIYFITARGQEFQEVTKEWLKKHGISYDKLFFSPYDDWKSSPEYKTEVIQKENIAILIDDLPENINHVNEETNCQGILFQGWKDALSHVSKLLSKNRKKRG